MCQPQVAEPCLQPDFQPRTHCYAVNTPGVHPVPAMCWPVHPPPALPRALCPILPQQESLLASHLPNAPKSMPLLLFAVCSPGSPQFLSRQTGMRCAHHTARTCTLVLQHDGWFNECCSWAGCSMRFGSSAKVLAKCKLKYYRISEWDAGHGLMLMDLESRSKETLLLWRSEQLILIKASCHDTSCRCFDV